MSGSVRRVMALEPSIAVDMRMLHSSGIGTYLENLVPAVVKRCPDIVFHLLGSKDLLVKLDLETCDRVKVIPCLSPVYSIREHVELWLRTPGDVSIFWAPHYNIPLWHHGKLLVTVHDVCHLAVPHFFGGVLKQLYARSMFSAVRVMADKILCVSQFTKHELMRLVGVAEDRIEVVHNGIHESWFELEPGRPVHGKRYVLYVGNVKPHKNVGMLLEAFDAIRHRIPHDLVLVGQSTGFRTADTRVFSHASTGGHRVVFTGRVGSSTLQQYVVQADVLILPSLYEGFGFPPLEAMACGCPTLVADISPLREVYGDATLYFDPRNSRDLAEKMFMALTNGDLRETLRRSGKIRARLYSWARAADQTVAVLETLLASQKGPRVKHRNIQLR